MIYTTFIRPIRAASSFVFELIVPLLFILSVLIMTAVGAKGSSSFVGTDNTTFTLGGRPIWVAGVNNHYLTYSTDTETDRVLDDAVALGANTVRIFLQPVIGSLDGSMPTIWDWKKQGESNSLVVNGTYLLYWKPVLHRMAINDNGLQRVDRVIAGAQKRNLKLIIGFLDFWGYTGGAQQMTAWYVDSIARPTSPLGKSPVVDYHFFFSDSRTKRDYKEWIKHVLERYNSVTGVQYRADPTIMAWELLNEPNIDSAILRHQWTTEMSSYVKTLDSEHLVGAGSTNTSPVDLAKDLVIPSIDYGTWHGYPIYEKITPQQLNDLIPQYCNTAAAYHKPVLLEEFGYARSNPDQIEVYRKWLNTLTSNRDCAGWLVWRLVSRQQDGKYPVDDYDQFDVRNDGSSLWHVLKSAIDKAVETRN